MWLARSLFGFVHQLVGALNQVRGEPPRDEAALGDASEPQADDADVDAHRLHGEPAVFERPVVALDRLAEALADRRAPGGTRRGRE